MPPSINKTMRAGLNRNGNLIRPGIADKNQYKEWIRFYCIANRLVGVILQGPLEISFTYVYPTGHTMDWEAGAKVLCDGIAEAIGFNDKLFKYSHTEVDDRHKGAPPHVEVEIRELEHEAPLWIKVRPVL